MSKRVFDLVAIARQWKHVREAQSLGQNQGQRVNAIQLYSGGKSALGTSWCAWMVLLWLDQAYQGASPIPRSPKYGEVQAIYELAKENGWVTSLPLVGDLFLYVNAADHAHHVGVVTATEPLTGIAGNTSADGTSANGDGVYEHAISAHVFVHLPEE